MQIQSLSQETLRQALNIAVLKRLVPFDPFAISHRERERSMVVVTESYQNHQN
jgi:hypothetical protein